ncbi:MAG TPA: hypothetical protein VEL76_16890, partial [Gemmataceae bacterium]|nr:hypothetical protein [Gemmataceae bacterium]
MKYLAILKDSVREALDNKVIYVMVGLSLLVTLFVLSAGFEPLPAEDMMARLLKRRILWLEDLHGKGQRPEREDDRLPAQKGAKKPVVLGEFAVQHVESLTPGAAIPDSSYRVTVVLPLKTREEADKIRTNPADQVARLRHALSMAEQYQYLKVNEVRLAVQQPPAVKADVA